MYLLLITKEAKVLEKTPTTSLARGSFYGNRSFLPENITLKYNFKIADLKGHRGWATEDQRDSEFFFATKVTPGATIASESDGKVYQMSKKIPLSPTGLLHFLTLDDFNTPETSFSLLDMKTYMFDFVELKHSDGSEVKLKKGKYDHPIVYHSIFKNAEEEEEGVNSVDDDERTGRNRKTTMDSNSNGQQSAVLYASVMPFLIKLTFFPFQGGYSADFEGLLLNGRIIVAWSACCS